MSISEETSKVLLPEKAIRLALYQMPGRGASYNRLL
jgi:hypothetical protein